MAEFTHRAGHVRSERRGHSRPPELQTRHSGTAECDTKVKKLIR